MSLFNKIQEIANRFQKQKENIQTEEATKNALVMPFIISLGYDVFNPVEVTPEYIADVGIKKGEKIDYVIKKDKKVIILIECKSVNSNLNKAQASQLYRYFSTTKARVAILTNGITYQFFSDIEEPNKMDSKPFFVFNILDFEEHHIDELEKLTKQHFSIENIVKTAIILKYKNNIKEILNKEMENPSEDFVRFFASKIHTGRLTKQAIDQFKDLVKDARNEFVNEKVNEQLKFNLISNLSSKDEDQNNKKEQNIKNDGIITTQEEIDAYNIVKSMLRNTVDVRRITMRDKKSYCNILLDNNNRKIICRLYFNNSKKYISFIKDKKENKISISDLNDIFQYSENIQASIIEHEALTV